MPCAVVRRWGRTRRRCSARASHGGSPALCTAAPIRGIPIPGSRRRTRHVCHDGVAAVLVVPRRREVPAATRSPARSRSPQRGNRACPAGEPPILDRPARARIRHPLPAVRCQAHRRRDGAPCGRWEIRGARVCPAHRGNARQTRRAAAERVWHAEVMSRAGPPSSWK